jgi:hypothetical protein
MLIDYQTARVGCPDYRINLIGNIYIDLLCLFSGSKLSMEYTPQTRKLE